MSAARPGDGFFETLIERAIGLDPQREPFLLSVLLGHPATPDGS